MSLSPVIGTEVPETANGVVIPVVSGNGPHVSVKCGGSRAPCSGEASEDGSLGHTENHINVENRVYDGEGHLDTEKVINERTSSLSLHTDPSLSTDTCTGYSESVSIVRDIPEASNTAEPPGAALVWDSTQTKDSSQREDLISLDRQLTEAETVDGSTDSRDEEEDGEMEKQDEEEDEKNEKKWRNPYAGRQQKDSSQHYSSSAPGPSTASSSSLPPPLLPSDDGPCPPHVMAQVWVRNVRGMQDSKSLDEISQACGADCSGPIYRSRGLSRRPADIPPIDPTVLLDLQRHTQEVAHSVEMMMRSLNGTIQNMTALSVGYIQTYRDSVDSLGESVDMSIKGMYTLMARCEELDRSMQPIHTLAAQIRDIKRTLDALEAICK
ncbi:BLOC-1-related complex subunit 6 isoform X2 [Hippoglossus hippoglossus]|uniref:BLOC-1-related complex subunit 6 isoform X2 n=1 Tax=Hippoglossus hippoglossus TaxID=8267 RepID=UPI00148C4667|nr:BLOC-1-related complex subunit 6 isoform X2 [Hippoglossus hippoglossus]